MSLPPEVLHLLGDDATPERAAERQAAFLGACLVQGEIKGQTPDVLALGAYDSAIAAAAILECEASRAYERDGVLRDDRALGRAKSSYDALRNWRKA